eukprot:2682646-Amphidinium_carterae.1
MMSKAQMSALLQRMVAELFGIAFGSIMRSTTTSTSPSSCDPVCMVNTTSTTSPSCCDTMIAIADIGQLRGGGLHGSQTLIKLPPALVFHAVSGKGNACLYRCALMATREQPRRDKSTWNVSFLKRLAGHAHEGYAELEHIERLASSTSIQFRITPTEIDGGDEPHWDRTLSVGDPEHPVVALIWWYRLVNGSAEGAHFDLVELRDGLSELGFHQLRAQLRDRGLPAPKHFKKVHMASSLLGDAWLPTSAPAHSPDQRPSRAKVFLQQCQLQWLKEKQRQKPQRQKEKPQPRRL